MFWGETDLSSTVIDLDNDGFPDQETALGKGMNFVLYEQTYGTFSLDPLTSLLGSANRIGADGFTGMGPNGTDLGFKIYLTGTSVPGFLGTGVQPTTEFKTTFAYGGAFGSADVYFETTDLGLDLNGDGVANAADVGYANPNFDTNIFIPVVPGYVGPADLHLTMTTLSNNPANTVGANGGFDWTATDFDQIDTYAVPEPMTMLGLMLGVGGLAGYIRKRRTA